MQPVTFQCQGAICKSYVCLLPLLPKAQRCSSVPAFQARWRPLAPLTPLLSALPDLPFPSHGSSLSRSLLPAAPHSVSVHLPLHLYLHSHNFNESFIPLVISSCRSRDTHFPRQEGLMGAIRCCLSRSKSVLLGPWPLFL